jgi:uncharacterized membrane protein YkoI
MRNIILPALAIMAMAAGALSPAFADHSNEHKEATALLASTKLTLAEAVSKAEALHLDSRALDAELDQNADGKAVWEITVVTADKIYDVILDAENGGVMSNIEDRD